MCVMYLRSGLQHYEKSKGLYLELVCFSANKDTAWWYTLL